MSATYSGSPDTDFKDTVRYLLGDTNVDNPLLQDEEINYQLSIHPDPKNAAYYCCNAILPKLARQVDYEIGPEKVKASQRYKQYKELKVYLRSISGAALTAPLASSDVMNGTVEPIFDVGMHDGKGVRSWIVK